MSRIRAWALANKLGAIAIALAVLFTGVASAVAVARVTDQPAFCQSACHEMQPFGAAWSAGPHSEIGCVECHVEPGMVARLTHKTEAAKELWAHLSGDPVFPQTTPPAVPDERCVRCHDGIETPRFDHAGHAEDRSCQSCHSSVGHEVQADALKAVGAFNEAAAEGTSAVPVAAADRGSANIAGHPATECDRCHDMTATGCDSCHTAKHASGRARKDAECHTCHNTSGDFAFTHPTDSPDCASCHDAPASEHTFTDTCAGCHRKPGVTWTFDHRATTGNCSDCHKAPSKHRAGSCETCHKPGADWTFDHPSSSSKCQTCHTRPAKHRAGACPTCHNTGKSWTFRHPKGNCTSCHNRPSGHRAGSCTTCHRTGVSWAFRHPRGNCSSCHKRPSGHRSGSCSKCHNAGRSWAFRHPNSGCTSCHRRPSGHRSGSCSSCHRAGKSWAFRHTSSRRCASCHKAPGGHYGSTCASCHSAGRKWSSAKFSHPRVPGGEHSYRSFGCRKCHPSGYSSHYCTCHKSTNGPKDDDDDDDDD